MKITWQEAVDRHLELGVYVPNEAENVKSGGPPTRSRLSRVTRGSGIAAFAEQPAQEDERLSIVPHMTVDYEGNLYKAENLATWEQRVLHAAQRHVEKYPTTARVFVPVASLVRVGTFFCQTSGIDVTDRPALDRWLADGT